MKIEHDSRKNYALKGDQKRVWGDKRNVLNIKYLKQRLTIFSNN